jgi:hypothetical protein
MTRPSRFTNPGANPQDRVGGYPDQPTGNDPPVTWPPPITDPDDFPDRAEEQPAQVPIALGTPALAQPIQSTRVLVVDGDTGTITFDDPLTPGNILVAGVAFRENIGATADLEGDGWNLIDDAYTGSEDGNWPAFLYWRPVQPGDGQVWDCTRSTGSGGFGFWMAEFSGVATLDVSLASSNATTEPTGSLTPGTSVPVMLVSFASVRNDSDQAFTAAGSMSEQLDTFYGAGDDGPQVAVNIQSVASPSGSYTVGSTYGGGSRRLLLAASFAGGTGFADGLNSVDGDDATYDETDTEEVIRVDLGAEYAIGRIRWLVGFDTSGAKSYDLMAANEPDFSDEVIATTLTPTGTGSYTAQEVADTWTPAGSYRFWRLVGAAESRRTFSFELYEIPDAGGGVTVHDDLTGRDAADQHPADAVTLDPTGLTHVTATDVQGGIGELDAAITAAGDLHEWFDVTEYGATGDGTTDDTSAIQDAIDACAAAGGGTVYFPAGIYQLDGALQSTGTYNAQLTIPDNAPGQWMAIRFLGADVPGSNHGERGSVLRSSWDGVISGTPAIISAGTHDSTSPNYVQVTFEHLVIEAPEDPKLTAIDMTNALAVRWDELAINVTRSVPFEFPVPWDVPTNANAVGMDMPFGLNSQPMDGGGSLYVEGFYIGLRPSEQCAATLVKVAFCAQGIQFRGDQDTPAFRRHLCSIEHVASYWNPRSLVFTGDVTWVNIGSLDIEHDDAPFTAVYDIDDASNYGRGFISWHTTDFTDGPEDDLLVNGGGGLSLHGGHAKRWRLNDVVEMPERSDPSAAAAGTRRMYAKTDGFYEIDDAGVVSPLGGGALDLDDLGDVVITAAAEADRLRFDGTNWVNSDLKWKPVLAYDPDLDVYLPVHSGGDPVMAEG